RRRDCVVCGGCCADHLWGLVLSGNETAADHHMRTKILPAFLLFIFSPIGQALACPFCYGAKDGKSTEHMAVAIWFLFGAVMAVLGGIGAFWFHLSRHGRKPAEPDHELTEEDRGKDEEPRGDQRNSGATAQSRFARIPKQSHPRVLPLVHGSAFRWMVGVFYFCVDSVQKTATAGGGSPRCEERHLDSPGIFSRVDRGGAPARLRDSTLGETCESVSAWEGSAGRPRSRAAIQLQLSPARAGWTIWPARHWL